MRIVGDNPKKSSWKIYKATYPDGKILIASGTYHSYGNEIPYAARYHERKGATVEAIDNVAFEASFKCRYFTKGRSAVIYRFNDIETDFEYDVGGAGAVDIFHALEDGRLQISNNSIKGIFTFVKKGSEVYMIPADQALINSVNAVREEPNVEGALEEDEVLNSFKP